MKSILKLCGLMIVFVSCKKIIPDNCEGEYVFKRPYTTSHPLGRVKVDETITLEITLPFDEYNHRSDSIVNIEKFNKVLCGISLSELVQDTSKGDIIESINAKNEFKYNSINVKIDFKDGPNVKNRIRFYLRKEMNQFIATVFITPLKKGVFAVGLFNGIIEDAFCNAGIQCTWGSFTPIENFANLEGFGKFRINNDLRNALILEKSGYFILVE